MIKNKYIHGFSVVEWEKGKAFMLKEVYGLHPMHKICVLLRKAIADFEAGKFSYDGATFVKERSISVFEVAAFIHDWRNAMGYISKQVDQEMFDVMSVLAYNTNLVIWRFVLTRFTFLNEWRHKLLCSYVGAIPPNLYIKPDLIFYSEEHPNN